MTHLQTQLLHKDNPHVLLVGGGIVGVTMAHTLAQRGVHVTLVDPAKPNSASRVAAGMLNPIMGKRIRPHWEAATLLREAHQFLDAIEHRLRRSFFNRRPIVRVFNSQEEQDYAQKRRASIAPFVERWLPKATQYANHKLPHGGIIVKGGGYIDLPLLLDSFREAKFERIELRTETLVWDDIQWHPHALEYKNTSFDACICCDGANVVDNPWFNYLPFKLCKGELITVQMHALKHNEIINKGTWLLPLDHAIAKIGATVEWNWEHERPSPEALNKLFSIFPEYQIAAIIKHAAGIRPCSHDTLPYVGAHPQNSRLFILNGFGGKACLLSAYAANRLTAHIMDQASLPEAIDVARKKGSH